MSLLAPLYIAGALAVALPIIFHLIRQTPQGRQAFSSLMFLSPSPPRITRRSRLSNILLLLLRAAALCLLAAAFARPFFFKKYDADPAAAGGRRVAILVDTSASMMRGDLWQQANQQVANVVRELGPADQVALMFFDRDVRPALTFVQWNDADPSQRGELLKARLADAQPTWSATRLGDALATAADMLAETEQVRQSAGDTMARQLVLISDLQQGSHADALQGHQWPANVSLEVRAVALADPTNASLQWVKDSADSADPGKLRVRVGNEPDSRREQFTLRWTNAGGPIAGIEPIPAYVPPGQSQILRIDWPAAERAADRLMIEGDSCEFDNTLFVVAPRQEVIRVIYLGDDAADDPNGLRFYIERLVGPKSPRKIDLRHWQSGTPVTDSDLASARTAIITAAPSADQIQKLRPFMEQGGDVLWVLRDGTAAAGLVSLAQAPLEVEEASSSRHALIARMQLDDPLFLPFADARFSDFTKIHFWKHRLVRVPQDSKLRPIAWFDNQDPFLLQQQIGRGRLLIATSGWNPSDSQLARSTKFVPLMDGLLARRDGTALDAQYAVDDPIPIPASAAPRAITHPDGRRVELSETGTVFTGADRPGAYGVQTGQEESKIAVNLPASEGRTSPIEAGDLAQWGAQMGARPVTDEQVARQRQLQAAEIENRQKLWHWLIAGVMILLIAETALAGRLTRRTFQAQVST